MELSLQALRFNHGVVEERYVEIKNYCLYIYSAGPQNTWVLDKVYDLFDVHTRTYKNKGEYVTLMG